jgi:hypothetical protein
VNIGIIGCVRSDLENQSTGGEAKHIDIHYGIWIVYKKWAGNRPWILGRCQQIETPGERSSWSATVRWVQDLGQPERPAVAIEAMNPRCL